MSFTPSLSIAVSPTQGDLDQPPILPRLGEAFLVAQCDAFQGDGAQRKAALPDGKTA
ncbi:hypothetical protein SynBIOSU31_01815 [Synechococcus sp. BIOS-U3-1]|nr:hypothetical protein SynBIOSU31_01815 [Synechococcus sp. BIOS-U3-1]